MRIAALGLLLCGCGLVDPAGSPLVVAHRSGAGRWPENSRTAVQGAVANNYPGIEFDLVLTKDLIPVLSHDPWMKPELCTHADGSPLPAGSRILIQDYTLSELQSQFRCGGVTDPEQPDAEVVADTHLTFDELLDLVRPNPQMTLHLDIKYEDGLTPPANEFVDRIYPLIAAKGNTNPWYSSSTEVDYIPLAKAAGVDIALTWPKFTADESTTITALRDEALAQLGLGDPLAIAGQTGATGLNLQYRVIDRRIVDAAKARGLAVQIWTVNAANVQDAYCRWPADVLITDYPEEAPCF